MSLKLRQWAPTVDFWQEYAVGSLFLKALIGGLKPTLHYLFSLRRGE